MGILKQNKQARSRRIISSLCHKHHFSSPNTTEIILSLLFLSIISRLLSLLGREAKY